MNEITFEELDFLNAFEELEETSKALSVVVGYENVLIETDEERLKLKYYKSLLTPLGVTGYESVEKGNLLLKIWNGIKVGVLKTLKITLELIIKAFKILYRFVTGKPVTLNKIKAKILEVRKQTVIATHPLKNEDKLLEKISKDLLSVFLLNGKIDLRGINTFYSVLNSSEPKEYNNIAALFEISKEETFLEKILPGRFLTFLLNKSKVNIPYDLDELLQLIYGIFNSNYYNRKTALPVLDAILENVYEFKNNKGYKINFVELQLDKIVIAIREYDAETIATLLSDIMSKLGGDYVNDLESIIPSLKEAIKYEKLILDKNKVNFDYKNVIDWLRLEEVESIVNTIQAQSKILNNTLKHSEKRMANFKYFVELMLKRADELPGDRGIVYKSLTTLLLNTEFKFILDSFAGLAKSIRVFNYYALYDFMDLSLERYLLETNKENSSL